jgi:transcriptional regulator with XRE-family HTH domain
MLSLQHRRNNQMPIKERKREHPVGESHFGLRLAAARRAASLTQAELANKADVHISHVQRIEAGTSQPTVEILKRLAQALQISLDQLVFDQPTEAAQRRLSDSELIEQFAAIESFSERDKQAIKTILHAMIVKQRVEAAVRQSPQQ